MLTWDAVSVLIKTVAGKRARELAELQGQFAAQGIVTTTIVGTSAEPPRENFRRLLRAGIEAGQPWIMHVEDDAFLAPDFAVQALACINRGVANVWSFYSARKEDLEALEAGKKYRRVTPTQFFNTQAVCFSPVFAARMLEDLPEWEAKNPQERSGVDVFIGWFCRKHKFIICVSVPSFVQHRQLPSLLGHRKRYGRISRTFALRYGAVPGEETETTEAVQGLSGANSQ